MFAGNIKGYNIYNISGISYKKREAIVKKLDKLIMSDNIEQTAGSEALKKEMLSALESGGMVYCLKRHKEIYGCIIFEKTAHSTGEFAENKRFAEIEGIKDKEECFIFELRRIYNSPELNEQMAEFENIVKKDIPEYFSLNNVSAAFWNDEIITAPEGRGADFASGMLMGMPLGLMLGWMLFKSIPMGLCFGLSFGTLFSAGLSKTKKHDKKEE